MGHWSCRRTAAHIIGSGMDLEITVNVENSKEDAFNTKLYVTLPIGITFKNKAGVKSVSTSVHIIVWMFIVCHFLILPDWFDIAIISYWRAIVIFIITS